MLDVAFAAMPHCPLDEQNMKSKGRYYQPNFAMAVPRRWLYMSFLAKICASIRGSPLQYDSTHASQQRDERT